MYFLIGNIAVKDVAEHAEPVCYRFDLEVAYTCCADVVHVPGLETKTVKTNMYRPQSVKHSSLVSYRFLCITCQCTCF